LFSFIALSAWEGNGFFPNLVLFIGYVGINVFAIVRNGFALGNAR
jgi:hypothetical protein